MACCQKGEDHSHDDLPSGIRLLRRGICSYVPLQDVRLDVHQLAILRKLDHSQLRRLHRWDAPRRRRLDQLQPRSRNLVYVYLSMHSWMISS